MTPSRLALLLLVLAGCSKGSSLTIPADRPLLLWSGTSATDANKAALPKGFTNPDDHVCAADPTRQYLGELFTQSGPAQVLWHWAPIVGGPDPTRPTLGAPDFSLAGTLVGASDSTDDILNDHPFGLDHTPDVQLDADFAFLSWRDESGGDGRIHTEVEQRTFPRAQLGWQPQAGDRVLMRGAWIFDCGHPPYGSELHPPAFIEMARAADATSTDSMSVAIPYRHSQFFNTDASLQAQFSNPKRFDDTFTKAFPDALFAAVFDALAKNSQHLATHGLLIPATFSTLDWLVCAPLPKPSTATGLDAHWRFTARTGVSISATQIPASGCVRFVATMSSSYQPMALTNAVADWPWADLNNEASGQVGTAVDVRQAIIDTFKKQGTDVSAAPALQPGNAPQVDALPALQPRAGADQDSPTAIVTGADDQPYPFYGRAHVGWK